jgi:hypothetical protein
MSGMTSVMLTPKVSKAETGVVNAGEGAAVRRSLQALTGGDAERFALLV